ncbi:MAG: 5-bromo-4-chloroindolyl phosphate hydrolysis family protein, partial [Clostridia bacterium]|nr:5-bromo-4-chloroindolyl phosphate hydrolysis family protein [Clostridia bacterium]
GELDTVSGQIRDQGVKCRANRIRQLTEGIFQAIIDKPEREADVRKFMNYYLPSTIKLLKSYELLEDQSVQGENITASREKIESVLNQLVGAYEKQLDRLFSDDALDIATEVDVLQTMMSGDGLSEKKGITLTL